MGNIKAYLYGGLGLLGLLTAVGLYLAVNAWLDERTDRKLAEAALLSESTRADHAEARQLEILEAYDEADANATERRDAIREADKAGEPDPVVGPRTRIFYRKLREQSARERDEQGQPRGGLPDPR